MKDDFAKFAADYVLFCHITTQIDKDKHQDLLQSKGGGGWPYLVFMDAEGDVIAEHQGGRDASGFALTGDKVKGFMDLKKKAEKGDKSVKIDFVIAKLDLGKLSAAEAQSGLKDLGKPSAEQQARLDALLVTAEVRDTIAKIREIRDRAALQPALLAAGKKFFEMKKAGKPAPEGYSEFDSYWIIMMGYAESKKDSATYEEALKALKVKHADNPQAAAFFTKSEATLKTIQEEEKKAKEAEKKPDEKKPEEKKDK